MKKKTKLLSLISTTLAGLALSLGVVGIAKKDTVETRAYYTPSTHYEVSDTASELASYYSSISDSDSGTSLLSKLQSLNSSKRKKTIGYSGIGTDTGGAVIYTDYDLNNTAKDSNGQTYGTKVASFYTKTSATSWNREHMWPNSHGGNNVEADILHTRPTISAENSSRGNSFYVEGKNNSSSGWDPYTAGYAEWCRGECARVILYCVVAYPNFTLSDADSHSTSNSNKDNMMGNMNTLIKWHFNYLPNVYEKNRNDGAEYLQGNRNPFVDHPEYVARIWSSFNSTVSSLCSSNSSTYSNWIPGNYCNFGSNTTVQAAEGVTISASSASVSVGSTTILSATSTDSGTISWTTSNSSVASISSSSSASGANITITGVGAGTATITAKRTISGKEYSSTCSVTVTKVVSSLSKGSTSPTKTTYTAGEHFDPTGLTITANYTDSSSGNVTSSVVWTPDPLTAGTTSVTGTFGGKTVTVTGLTVNAATEPEIIDSNSDLSVGDYVVLRTAAGVGVTGWNNSKDATVSETNSAWKRYYVASASSSGFTLKDESANSFIASPGSSNQFVYGSAATCSTDSSGHLICNSRYLCKNGNNYRFYTSISSYLPFFIYKVPAPTAKTLSSITIYEEPDKLSYTAGEYFDPTGLEITRTYSDNSEDNYSYAGHTSEFTFSPSTSTALTTGNTSVTITYGGKSCDLPITVNAAKTLSSISVSTAPTKTTYTAGEYFDPAGLVIARNYSDSTSDTYTYSGHTSDFTFSPSTSTALTTSNASVTITCSGKSTTQAITVNAAAKTLSSISISGYTTSFTLDDTFVFGGTVTANFSDSTSSNVTASATFSGYNMSVAGNYTVTVSYTYSGTTKTAQYQITVNSSGGSGGGTESGSQRISASTTSTYYESGDICPTGSTSSASATCDAFDVSWLKNSGNDIVYNYAEMRVYSNNSFMITPKSGYTITSVVITANSSSYANAVGGTSLTNCTKTTSNVTVTLNPTDGTTTVGFINSAQSRLNYIVVNYEYESSGSTPEVTSISATVSKSYYVGETISKSDITVKDSNNKTISQSNFAFANDGYQFTYSDAASGGAATSKTFTNAVTYSTFSCSLTVNVSRKAYNAPSGTSSLEHTGSEFSTAGIDSSYATDQTATVDGITFSVDGYIYSSKLSLSSSKTSAPGKVINTSPYPGGITDVTVNGASPDVQLSTDGNSWVDLEDATTSTTNYYYLKLYYSNTSQSNFINIISFAVTFKASETAENVSNYIMYADTNNQCVSKLPEALGYYKNLSDLEKTEFQTSDDYVISSARTRLEAWALSQGKTIDYNTGNLTNKSNVIAFGLADGDTSMTLIIIVSGMSIISLSVLLIIKKKRLHN